MDKLLQRVRKLLALADSPNVHEAAAAAARAQALITEHRLERWMQAEAAVRADPITDGRDQPLDTAKRIRKWKGVLANILADANDCVAWIGRNQGKQALYIIGRSEDRDAVTLLWNALAKRIEWLSATEGPGRSRAWHEAFRIGAASAIAEQLQRAAPPETTPALTRIDPQRAAHQQALGQFVEQHLSPGKSRPLTVISGAYDSGHRAGNNAFTQKGLRKPVE